MNVKGVILLTNACVHRAFMDAERPVTNEKLLERHQVLRYFSEGKLLKMWCDIQEFDYERVRKKMNAYLDESIKHYPGYYTTYQQSPY